MTLSNHSNESKTNISYNTQCWAMWTLGMSVLGNHQQRPTLLGAREKFYDYVLGELEKSANIYFVVKVMQCIYLVPLFVSLYKLCLTVKRNLNMMYSIYYLVVCYYNSKIIMIF